VPPIAILSDIHGNRHALDAVREDIDRRGISAWWCVGDLVGYGADPVAVLDTCRAESARCVGGNHDLVVAGRLPIATFASWARDAALWTIAALGADRCEWLGTLLPVDRDDPVTLAHASLRDPVWEYVTTVDDAEASLTLASSTVTCIGHTHVPALWHQRPDGAVAALAATGTVGLGPGRWLVNPGSVGQPRDGDARASWAVFESETSQIEFVRTAYDIAGAQAAIRSAGLPTLLADRLGEGF
jgi:predicted phosphodiesterase